MVACGASMPGVRDTATEVEPGTGRHVDPEVQVAREGLHEDVIAWKEKTLSVKVYCRLSGGRRENVM